mmetsp:Transcript_31594/g.43983  ORF Transcript_31594/g.43983 Transcript_31594/m.43983 type:complete len:330 (-) Transcript_31594:170-1159(-)
MTSDTLLLFTVGFLANHAVAAAGGACLSALQLPAMGSSAVPSSRTLSAPRFTIVNNLNPSPNFLRKMMMVPPRKQRQLRARSDVKESTVDSIAVSKKEAELLKFCAFTGRGTVATVDERAKIDLVVEALEGLDEQNGVNEKNLMMNGNWKLVYTSEDVTRSSPFFWAFRKATKGISQPLPVLPSQFAEAVFAITDGIPFAKKGQATQRIELDSFGDGFLISMVEVELSVFDAILPPQTGFITTTSKIEAGAAQGSSLLTVQTTQIKESSWENIPILASSVKRSVFPSNEAFERVAEGSSKVEMRTTYLSDELRIARNEAGSAFVFQRVF